MSLENACVFLNNVKETELSKNVLNVFGKYAQSFEQFDDVSKTFFKIKDYDNALVYGEKARAQANTPDEWYTIMHNLINVYNHNNNPEKALEYISECEQVKEHDNDRDFEKSFALFLSNRKSEAATMLRDKLSDQTLTEEQRTKLIFNLGTYDLIDGNLQQGLHRFLVAGEQMGVHKTFINQNHETYKLPRWNGVIRPGLKLLLIAEAGIGDEIINVRFVHDLIEYGIDPIWLTLTNRSELVDIYRLNGILAYSNIKQIPIDFIRDCQYIPSMQLPIHLRCEYKDLWKSPYLTNIPIEYNEKWKKIMNSSGLKVGLRWQGNPSYDQDLHRSIPLIDIVNSIHIEAELFSLQKDNGVEELNNVVNVIDLSYQLDTLSDLFACINNLDLVITSCTSIAHIAAAMGKEVCVIVPISCYYIWCNPSDTTPWYGNNVHIFYQKQPRSWIAPLIQLDQYLIDNYK